MKNLFLLPTDKPSRLIKSQDNDFVYLNTNAPNWFENNLKTIKQNIYITSDEEIKVGDWYVSIDETIRQSTAVWDTTIYDKCPNKKIILTTDDLLIKDGVQSIDDDFLEWFVKNPSCEGIYVNKIESFDFEIDKYVYNYKIIIPKEEPKQETLEEFANKAYPFYGDVELREAIELGAKWQQEQNKKMYSEEDMHKLMDEYQNWLFNSEDVILTFREWFEKSKNK